MNRETITTATLAKNLSLAIVNDFNNSHHPYTVCHFNDGNGCHRIQCYRNFKTSDDVIIPKSVATVYIYPGDIDWSIAHIDDCESFLSGFIRKFYKATIAKYEIVTD